MRHIVSIALIVAAVSFLAAGASAGVLVLPANEIVSGAQPVGKWWDLGNVFANDSMFAADTVFTPVGDHTFSISFADPAGGDTLNRVITNVTMYVDNRVHYSKGGKLWLYPVYDGAVSGYQSRVLKVGYTETVNKYDITLHDTIISVFPDTAWHWNNVTTLGMQYNPRTARIIYYVDQVFATVTYQDTLLTQNYRFVFEPVAGPQTVGVPFPVTVNALDSVGNPLITYNGSANLWDSKAAVTPVVVTFANGVATFDAVVADTAVLDTLFISDGTAVDTSNGFAVELGGVRRFDIDSIGTQACSTAFPVTITAANYFGDPVDSFSDAVMLSDATGTLAPTASPAFANGVCTFDVTVNQESAADVISCTHALGTGQSNAFLVGPPVGVTGAPIPGGGAFRATFAPNPSISDLALDLNLPRAGRVSVTAFNILGQPVQRAEYGSRQAGSQRLPWRHGPAMTGGVYFFTIDLDGKRMEVRKLLVVR